MRNTFIILFCLFLSQFVKAQSYPAVSLVVGTTYTYAGAGQYYNGIYIQLDRTYDQGITVNGYWHDSDGPDVGLSFSIVIPRGTTYYATGDYYGTTTSTEIFVTSITPTLVTHSNVTYNTQYSLGNADIPVTSNPNNPVEYIGSYHNQACISMIQTMNFSTATTASILSNVDGFLTSKGYSASSFDSWYNSAVAAGYYNISNISSYANDVDAYCSSLYSQGIIDLQVKNYLHQLFAAVDTYVNDGDMYSYYAAADQIIYIENAIQADNTLSANDKNGLLSVAAVLRFSGANWANYLINNGGAAFNSDPLQAPFAASYAYQGVPHGPNVNMTAQQKLYFRFSWRKFWKSDAVGAIGGFFGGIFGGLGAGLLGALGGAIGGSVAYVAFPNL